MFIGLISVGREKCESDKIGVRTREALCAGAGAGGPESGRGHAGAGAGMRPEEARAQGSRLSRASPAGPGPVGIPTAVRRNVNISSTLIYQRDNYFLGLQQSK